jgi:pimeloyl-ACP methyl ester carboxylesterase
MTTLGSDAVRALGRDADACAPLVVFVHGLDDRWESWCAVADELGARWRTIALDLPWRAGSGYGWRRSGSAGVWLARLLDNLDEPVDVLVGHSYGANAVLDVLAHTKFDTSAAVLFAPFYRPSRRRVSWSTFGKVRELFGQVVTEGLIANLGSRAAELDSELIAAMVRHHIEYLGPMCFLTMFEELVATSELPLDTVRIPTLLLAGREDPTLPEGSATALARALPNATVARVDDLHHTSHVHTPAAVANHILAFLAAVNPRRSVNGVREIRP